MLNFSAATHPGRAPLPNPLHRYTLSNLEFAVPALEALGDEQGAAAAKQKLEWSQGRRAAERPARPFPTVPSTLGGELAYNPFVRASLRRFASDADSIELVARLREDKNNS